MVVDVSGSIDQFQEGCITTDLRAFPLTLLAFGPLLDPARRTCRIRAEAQRRSTLKSAASCCPDHPSTRGLAFSHCNLVHPCLETNRSRGDSSLTSNGPKKSLPVDDNINVSGVLNPPYVHVSEGRD